MKIRLVFIIILMLINFFCTSNNDLSVTQTGNPVKANIYYAADTTSLRAIKNRGEFKVDEIKILTAQIVISEIRIKSIDDNDSLNFRNEMPVILNLALDGKQTFLDSAITLSGTSYERIRYRIDQLEIDHGDIYINNTNLQNRSILVTGYIDNDTSKVYNFFTELDETIEFEFETPITIPNVLAFNFIMQFKIIDWFQDKDGGLLDPRAIENKSEIEGNIKNSIKIVENH